MGTLANMANCDDSDTARKACVIALANAVGSKSVMPNSPRRKSTLDEMAAMVLRLAEKATDSAPAALSNPTDHTGQGSGGQSE
jgi:microcystin degradation protein MlrC